ncbi:hypothetical protein D3C81_1727710 [compost metagenome]
MIQFMGMNFKEAVDYLLATDVPQHQPYLSLPKATGKFQLPEKAPNYRRVAWYLSNLRGIDPEVISCLMHEKKLYQQGKTGNCVFI